MAIENAVAEYILGTMGAVAWSVQIIPQIWKSYRRKDVDGLSSHMLFIWWVGGIFLGAYVILEQFNLPLLIQPQCFNFFSAISWGQCMYYGQGWSKKKSILAVIIGCILSGSLEASFIFGSRALESVGNSRLTTACGILSAFFITIGLLPQFVEIYRYKAVIGISLWFLLVDLLGGVFSLLSLVFAPGPFDTLGSLAYGLVALLEIGVFILAAILNPIHRRKLRAQRQADEDLLEGRTSHGEGEEGTGPVSGTSTFISSVTLPELEGAAATERRGRAKEVSTLSWSEGGGIIGVDMEEISTIRRSEGAERSMSRSRRPSV